MRFGWMRTTTAAAAVSAAILAVSSFSADSARAQAGQACAGLTFNQTGNGFFTVGAFSLNPGDTLNVTVTAAAGVTTQVFFLAETRTINGNGTATFVAPNTGNVVSGNLDAQSNGTSTIAVGCTPTTGGGGGGTDAADTQNEADGNTQQIAGENGAEDQLDGVPNPFGQVDDASLDAAINAIFAEIGRVRNQLRSNRSAQSSERHQLQVSIAIGKQKSKQQKAELEKALEARQAELDAQLAEINDDPRLQDMDRRIALAQATIEEDELRLEDLKSKIEAIVFASDASKSMEDLAKRFSFSLNFLSLGLDAILDISGNNADIRSEQAKQAELAQKFRIAVTAFKNTEADISGTRQGLEALQKQKEELLEEFAPEKQVIADQRAAAVAEHDATVAEIDANQQALEEANQTSKLLRNLIEDEEFLETALENLQDRLEPLLDERDRRNASASASFNPGTPGGFRLGFTESGNRDHVNFGWSLAHLRGNMIARRRAELTRLGITGDGTSVVRSNLPALLADNRLNAWVDGNYSYTDDERAGAQSEAYQMQFSGGVSYRVMDNVAVGGKLRYRGSRSKRDDGSQRTEADGLSGALFAQIALPRGAMLSPVVAWERSSTDLDLIAGGNTVSSTFTTDVFTVGGTVSRRFDLGKHGKSAALWIDPNASVSWVTAIRDDHVRSDGAAIAGNTLVEGSAVFGPVFGADITNPFDGITSMSPTLGLNAVWNFRDGGDFVSSNGTVVKPVRFSGTLSAGLGATFDNGVTARMNTAFSGIGSEVHGMSLGFRVDIPLQ